MMDVSPSKMLQNIQKERTMAGVWRLSLQGTGGRGNMQSAIHIDRITSRDHLPYTRPAERSEGGADAMWPY